MAVQQFTEAIKKPFMAIRDAFQTAMNTINTIAQKIKAMLTAIKQATFSTCKFHWDARLWHSVCLSRGKKRFYRFHLTRILHLALVQLPHLQTFISVPIRAIPIHPTYSFFLHGPPQVKRIKTLHTTLQKFYTFLCWIVCVDWFISCKRSIKYDCFQAYTATHPPTVCKHTLLLTHRLFASIHC